MLEAAAYREDGLQASRDRLDVNEIRHAIGPIDNKCTATNKGDAWNEESKLARFDACPITSLKEP